MLSAILKRQFAGEEQLPPYNFHVRDHIVSLEDGRLAFVVRCKGLPFESISDPMLESQYDSLNDMLLGIAKSSGARLAVWTHLDHYQTRFESDYRFSYQWMREFNAQYMEKFAATAVYENNFYLSFVLKPGLQDDLDDCIRELEEIMQVVVQMLAAYECELLGVYTHQALQFSELYEFIAYLYNGFWERVPVTSLPLFQAVQTSALHHGYQLIETRTPNGGNRFGAYFDLKDFPEPTTRGKFNALLELPFPFLLCLSFTFIHGADAIHMINQAINKNAVRWR